MFCRALSTHRHCPSFVSTPLPQAVFVGNGLMAIVSGLLASFLVDRMGLGPVAPFDASIAVLLAGGAVVATSWAENYGDAAHRAEPLMAGLRRQFATAFGEILGGGRDGRTSCRVWRYAACQ